MTARTQAYINIRALHLNLNTIRKLAPKSKILAMVKGNAYGHGLVAIGKALTEIDAFGVACLSEAIKLRDAGIKVPIVIMSGVFTEVDLHQVVMHDLQIVVHDISQIKLLEATNINQPIHVWLKIDTGMHRLGFLPDDFLNAYSLLEKNPQVRKPIVVMTHLANADNTQKRTTLDQLALFHRYTANLNCPKSAANSAGILAWPDSVQDWNRPGIMLYGVSPILNKTGALHNLLPVMTLKSKLIAIHHLKKGDAIGYGGCWLCPENMPVGVVAIGYGDGYPRHAKNGTPTLIKDVICPLVGRVSMDLITIDLRACPYAKIGDDVTLWGDGLPAELVAKCADTIAYELLCNVSQRVVFIYQS
jgi:alanine racemase